MAQSITFNSDRKVDKTLFQKLDKLTAVAPYCYDDTTGTARKLLHNKLDEVMEELGLKIDISETQPVGLG